jgi:signal transduction histidine kinase/ligand-binding sensor domain-containing protein
VTSKAEFGKAMACLLFLAAFPNRSFALDPSQPFSSYLKTHFTDEDGLPASVVQDMVQSRDGFLWLTFNGALLTRFDGRHFTPFDHPFHVRTLALAPDGDLWVATRDGLERIPAAALNEFGNLPGIAYPLRMAKSGLINCLRFSRNGVLWVGTDAGLFRFENGVFSPVVPGPVISRIKEASNGYLWVTSSEGFIEWDGSQAIRHPEIAAQLDVPADKVFDVMEDSHGVTWFCTTKGVARRAGGSIEKLAGYGLEEDAALRVYEDPQGNVWFSGGHGLYRATGSSEELAVPGIRVNYVYGDRDGDLWVATNGDGLYRFKDRTIQMFTTSDGLPNKLVMTTLVTAEGELWTGSNCGGISRFNGLRFQTYNEKDGLLNSCVMALAEDTNRDLWIGTYGGGAFRFRDGRFTQFSKSQGFGTNVVMGVLIRRDRSVWFASPYGLTSLRDGQIRTYTVADGLSSNVIVKLFEDKNGFLWVGTNKGLDRLDDGRFVHVSHLPAPKIAVFPLGQGRSSEIYVTVAPSGWIFGVDKNMVVSRLASIRNFSPTGMARTEQGDLWFTGDAIFRVPANALGQSRDPDEPLDYTVFGAGDGLLPPAESPNGSPNSALTRDGKLWIATTQGLAMIDLPRLPKRSGKPAIYVEEVTVGRNTQFPGHSLVLPSGTHHLDLQFDAVEVSSPERIRLQYRLDGIDPEWLDADQAAHATYSDIPPGTHAFHMRACNRDGIWDRTGTVYSITQLPYFYQTRLFQFGSGALLIVVLAGAYRFRVRQIAAAMNSRFDERLAERTRIARDFHDTLLQTIHASKLVTDDALAMNTDPGPSRDALSLLSGWLGQATEEGRSALNALRSSTVEGNDLAEAFRRAGAECLFQRKIEFAVSVEGSGREMHPIVRDEVYRIGYEAIRNACAHSGADRVAVELSYLDNLVLRIHDNGKGIDPDVAAKGRGGHFGLVGMYERAARIKGKLTISSSFGAGTDVELVVPRSIVFQSANPVRPGVLDNIKQFFLRPFRRGL